LMMILFVGGVMSLLTIAVLSTIVLLEKQTPRGDVLARIGGGVLIVCGLVLISTEVAGYLPSG